MKLTMMNLFKVVWLIACFVMLAWTFVACGREANDTLRGECSILAAIIMAFLTFPVGLRWWLLISATGYVLSVVGIELGGASAIADLEIGRASCRERVWMLGVGGSVRKKIVEEEEM